MSKIICEVCGTSYPETAEQCPICGTVRPVDIQGFIQDEVTSGSGQSGYTYVKGGRFSKANVKKRNMERNTSHMDEDAEPVYAEPQYNDSGYSEPDEPEVPKTNKGLIITAVLLFMAIIVVLLFIFLRLSDGATLFGSDKEEPVATTEATTVPTTETTQPTETETVETTQPTEELRVCTGLSVLNLPDLQIEFSAEAESFALDVVCEPLDTTDVLLFTSSDESVATVSDTGVVTAVSEGMAMIIIECGDQIIEFPVYCNLQEETTEPLVEYTIDDIILKKYNGQLDIQVNIYEPVKVYYGNIPLDVIKLTIEDPSVAMMDGDKVIGLKKGITKLVAEYGDLKVTLIIRVTNVVNGTAPTLPGSSNASPDE